MIEVSHRASLTAPFSSPPTPSSPTRPGSPAKRTSVVGDSNSFLTALAAHERRVLELREELQKAEDDLSRLKKQWATHEAIKKRNEFRHREQLQKLGPATRSSLEECRMRHHDPAGSDPYDRPFPELGSIVQGEQADCEQKADYPISTRQIQRRIFSGSRHTRALSLLSKAAPARNNNNLVLQQPNSQVMPPTQTNPSIKRSKTMGTRRPPQRTCTQEMSNGPPKEVFIETGKQIVGDLRDGLWTFFEDLRQATVGEDASSDPNRSVKATPTTVNTRDPQGDGQEEYDDTLDSLLKDRLEPGNTIRESPIIVTPIQQRPMKQCLREGKRVPQFCNNVSGQTKQAVDLDDEDAWDTWDSPVVRCPAASALAESINSDSVTSPSTRRESPRSSLSSLEASSATPHTGVAMEHPTEIPWPALTKLSPSNLKMTASTLMSEWERTMAHSATLDLTAATYPPKTRKAE
ncbi:MAG: hypothetical protein Q9169_002050 [Polycauliona sp. 2 TL-2023]